MSRSATMRIPRPGPPADVEPAESLQPPTGYEAAATLASRTSIGSETMGADGKAAIVLTLLGIMFTVLARRGSELGELLRHGVGTGTGLVRVACAVLLAGFCLSALCAMLQSFRTITPRFRKDKPSLAFFFEIAAMERQAYVERVESLTMQEAVDQILVYNHTAATICAEKFKELARALRCFEAAAVCWLLLVAILVLRSVIA